MRVCGVLDWLGAKKFGAAMLNIATPTSLCEYSPQWRTTARIQPSNPKQHFQPLESIFQLHQWAWWDMKDVVTMEPATSITEIYTYCILS